MKFAELIREAGFIMEFFPKASQIPIHLYDGNASEIFDEHIQFVKPLFADNTKSEQNFHSFVQSLEDGLSSASTLEPLFVYVDESCVFIRDNHGKVTPFPRNS